MLTQFPPPRAIPQKKKKVFRNDAMKPSILEDHLKICHSYKQGKDMKYFQTLEDKV